MFDLTRHVEVQRLLERIETVEDRLTPNELELVRSLKAKYAEPGHGDFDDETCLRVILRNVEIRKHTDFDPRRDGSRVIDFTPSRRPPKS